MLLVILLSFLTLYGCREALVPYDTRSLLLPRFLRSEIFGFVAGFGTTFAAVPDLVAMLSRVEVVIPLATPGAPGSIPVRTR